MSNYDSPTGLYSIRFGRDLIHEAIDHVECSELMDYYRARYDRMNKSEGSWPMDPDEMRVEPFNGTLKLSAKKR